MRCARSLLGRPKVFRIESEIYRERLQRFNSAVMKPANLVLKSIQATPNPSKNTYLHYLFVRHA
jgi:hypothetical protein